MHINHITKQFISYKNCVWLRGSVVGLTETSVTSFGRDCGLESQFKEIFKIFMRFVVAVCVLSFTLDIFFILQNN